MRSYMEMYLYFFSFLLTFYLCESDLVFKYKTLYHKEGRLVKKDDLQRDSVNVLRPIIFVLNGLDSSDNAWVNALIDEYLEKQIHNLFLLELEDQKEVGSNASITNEVKDFIDTIYNKTGEQYLHLRFIGIAGPGFELALNVGRIVSNQTARKVDRITGLDPTYHSSKEYKHSVDTPDDVANLVDVVHSNIRKFDGELKQIGHVDFYIDDPSCKDKTDPECGRLNAITMFKRSVNSETLTALKCPSLEDFEYNRCNTNSKVLFGENMPNNADGIYILKNEQRTN